MRDARTLEGSVPLATEQEDALSHSERRVDDAVPLTLFPTGKERDTFARVGYARTWLDHPREPWPASLSWLALGRGFLSAISPTLTRTLMSPLRQRFPFDGSVDETL